MNDKSLDKLLKEWVSRHAADEDRLSRLSGRIQEAVVRDRPQVHRPPRRLSAVLRYGAIGAVAASLLVCAIGFWVSRRSTLTQQSTTLQVASISEVELGDCATLYREVERLFAGDLRWVANADAGLQMGIRPVSLSGEASRHARPLLIRVVVLQRQSADSSWHEVLKTDVLTHGEELVELPGDPDSGGRLSLWAYSLPDGKVVVDSKIALAGPIEIGIDVSNVLIPGEPAQVFRLKTKEGECRVFQVVTPLPRGEDVPCYDT